MSLLGRLTRSRPAAFAKFTAAASLTAVGAWQLWTSDCYFEPFGPENDHLFQSETFKKFNPGKHPSLNDSCVRKVPLSQIQPELVNDAIGGGSKLLERFCAGMWGGYGFSIQRNILTRIARNDTNKGSALWEKDQLLSSTYEPGTNVTDHFLILAKSPKSIVMWGAESPSDDPGVRRPMENIAELTAELDLDRGVVEFRYKNIFYNGVERTSKALFPPPIVWLHFQYCKLLVKSGVSHCMV
ncbi:uncharacterized protein BO66DRAFT_432358 [Aspergillus aculeatinus CBS 121060]|uniref:Uncharacterized protein n=1 Tax=Aspergillus aculeatinus CBS 121060 TaxID=1448322 RepID=A0ACD1GV04_9EURO|nr:hypothetical protein BO66DRAFT_432358 [Aspergillus aculeatinus CBS 121060]RAH64998.1 hypothetical protein BO66DRAFT_432358 [Aspergillus aculeatinus CBS 121060]